MIKHKKVDNILKGKNQNIGQMNNDMLFCLAKFVCMYVAYILRIIEMHRL